MVRLQQIKERMSQQEGSRPSQHRIRQVYQILDVTVDRRDLPADFFQRIPRIPANRPIKKRHGSHRSSSAPPRSSPLTSNFRVHPAFRRFNDQRPVIDRRSAPTSTPRDTVVLRVQVTRLYLMPNQGSHGELNTNVPKNDHTNGDRQLR